MSKHNSKKTVSYDLDTKFIQAALKLKAAPNKSDEGDFVKSFEKAGNFADKINVIGKFSIGRTDLYSVVLDINKDIKADLEDKDNMKRLLQALYVSALIKFAFVPKVHEGELTKYIPLEFQILERQIHQLIASVIDSKKEVEVEEVDVAPEEEIGAEKETESGFSKAFGAVKETVKKAKGKVEKEVKKAKADKESKEEVKKEEPKETKTESKPEAVNVNPVQPAVEDEKAQRPADANNTFYNTLKQLEAVALQREAQWYATSSPEDSNSAREYAYQQYAQRFGTDPICIPEYRAYLANFLSPEESAMFFADVQQPGFVNPQQPMGYQPVQQPVQPQQPVAPVQATVSEAVVQDVQPQQAPEQPVQVDAPQATVSEAVAQPTQAPLEVKEKLETSDHDLTECVAKYLGYKSYKHFMNTFLDANAMKRKAKINKTLDVDKVILNFTYLIRDAITKMPETVLRDAILNGGRFRVSGVHWLNNVPFVVLRNNKMVLQVNALDYLKPGNIITFRINEQGKDAWNWMRIQTGEIQPLVFIQNQAQQTA